MKGNQLHIVDQELKEKLDSEKKKYGHKNIVPFLRFIVWDWFKIQEKKEKSTKL